MTAPASPAPKVVAWYVRPTVILPILAACVLVSALVARVPSFAREGDSRLTTRSSEPQGARMLFELSKRLGWQVRRDESGTTPDDPGTIFSVLDPTVQLSAEEVHGILEHVRHGGALVTALGAGTEALSDSIGLEVDARGSSYLPARTGASRCRDVPTAPLGQGLWIGPPSLYALKGDGLKGSTVQAFISVPSPVAITLRPSMIGLTLGAGRMVVASDPDVFRNDALRECSYGFDVVVVRALEFARAGGVVPRNEIVFDEFHLGRGRQQGMFTLVGEYLRTTSSGHTVLQLTIAGLLVLLGAAVRVLPPREERRIERRSPLEHVDALARAYQQVGATRTAALRLIQGVRRRVDRTAAVSQSPGASDLFLSRVAEAKPALAGDVTLVRRALESSVPERELAAIGAAFSHIETSLTVPAALTKTATTNK